MLTRKSDDPALVRALLDRVMFEHEGIKYAPKFTRLEKEEFMTKYDVSKHIISRAHKELKINANYTTKESAINHLPRGADAIIKAAPALSVDDPYYMPDNCPACNARVYIRRDFYSVKYSYETPMYIAVVRCTLCGDQLWDDSAVNGEELKSRVEEDLTVGIKLANNLDPSGNNTSAISYRG